VEVAAAAVGAALSEWEQQQPAPQQKMKPRPKSGYYGVRANGSKWQANITYGGKPHHLGLFNTKEEAAAAYDEAARESKPDLPLNFSSVEVAAAAAVEVAVSEWEQQQPAPQQKTKPRLKPQANGLQSFTAVSAAATFPAHHIVSTLMHTAQSSNGSGRTEEEELLDDFFVLASAAPITVPVVAFATQHQSVAATAAEVGPARKKQKKVAEVTMVRPQQKRNRSKANAIVTKSAPQPKPRPKSGYRDCQWQWE